MRVIAGKYKGRILETVKDFSVRPATSRVKESIFNILQSRIDWTNASVLDLYAGSGSIGIEALSRGAKSATFVEQSHKVAAFLRKNIESIGADKDARVWIGDAVQFIETSGQSFTVVFTDPPYADTDLVQLPVAIFQRGIVAQDGVMVMEHPDDIHFEPTAHFMPIDTRKYGRTVVTFFKAGKEAHE
ncbi:MAG: 16S rRNA (guanine(966)-N(2))-methyltransferase RsmD [Ignavibacteriales bacterium]|nr:16S rRNA (guanine(966)-N(2))-methyltransferase RsmD [Ignavibacteriales bacterium]